MKALNFYHELIKSEINDSIDHGLNKKKSFIKNIINLLVRKTTTQQFRLGPLKIRYLSKIPYFSKEFGLDYLEYIIANNPEIPYAYYPELDKKEIDYFLKMSLKGAFYEGYTNKDFGNRWSKFEKTRSKVGRDLKFNLFSNIYELYGFKSVVYPDTGIFPDNYHLEIFKSNKHKVCLDIGAYIGDSAYAIDKILKPKKIYAFEPDVYNLKVLTENINLNRLHHKIIPVNCATGSKKGVGYFESVNASSSLNEESGTDKVVINTIDSFVKEQKIKKVDLIKMDIEGAELDTLYGAKTVIKRDKPDLVIAIYHRGKHFFEFPSLLRKMVKDYNFRFVPMSGSSPVIERFIMASTKKI